MKPQGYRSLANGSSQHQRDTARMLSVENTANRTIVDNTASYAWKRYPQENLIDL
jgi:hypothetical protein